ncbi:MAG: EAL domain-containing protein, partial [Thermodesulfovibrionales bacterium]|nr:EAL domain-containing protein [Thermodesulfovibrionales bacterium]
MPKCFQIYHGTDAPPSGCPSCESTKTKKPCIHEIYEPHLDMFLEIRAIPRLDSEGNITGLIHVGRDISKRKEMENELTRQALYDSLTDLPNRALFNDRLGNLFGHKERNEDLLFAVLFLDLDHFKRINDTLGHVFGDKLLVAVAERLRSCVRPGDTVSRFGGDEFVIILDELNSKAEAMAVNERIHHTLGAPIIIGGSEIFITASIGIAFNTPEYKLPEHILRDADNAMYHAKVRGRAQHAVFDEEMRFSTMKTMTLENDLRRAVERREFKLHYQPIVNLETGGVSGFEALLRWDHPTEGIVLPEMFISAAEETGLIVPLGDWVLETACSQIGHWQNSFPKKPPLTVSVNISGKEFDASLPVKVEKALKNAGLGPESLTIEITESTLMENAKLATEIMNTLNDMGVHVYLDDFGTGYSSLRYIHTFPVKALKIDRSFVRNISEDREAREIVRAIASLAKNLNMVMIVEGVEDIKHLEIFRALQCQYAQGFLFSRPLAPADIETYMEKHSSAAL